MNNKFSYKKTTQNLVFVIILISATMYILLRGQNFHQLFSVIKSVKTVYLTGGLICGLMFVLGEALNIKVLLKMFSHEITLSNALKYAFAGFFFSSITPSSSGGQPMQVYYMKKDNIPISHSSIVLLITLACFQTVIVLIGIFSSISLYRPLVQTSGLVKYFVICGVLINSLVLVFIMLSIFSKKFIILFQNIVNWILDKVSFRNKDKFKMSVKTHLAEYSRCSDILKNNKATLLKILLITTFQITFMFSIPYVVYRAIGLNTASYSSVFLLQSVLYTASSSIPLPGGVGVSESSFLTLFQSIYPSGLLSLAMLLSRGISFYSLLIISGLVIISYQIISNRNTSLIKQ